MLFSSCVTLVNLDVSESQSHHLQRANDITISPTDLIMVLWSFNKMSEIMFKFQLLQVPAPLKWATPWGMLFLAFCGPVTLVFPQSLQDTRCLPPLESLYSLFPLCQEELVITKWLWQARDDPKCFLFIILLTTILNFLLYSSPRGQWGTKIQSLVATQLLDPGFKPSLCMSWALALNHFTLLLLLTSYILLTLIYPSWL